MHTTNKNRYTTVVQKSPEAQALKLTFSGGGVDMFPVDCPDIQIVGKSAKNIGTVQRTKTKQKKAGKKKGELTREPAAVALFFTPCHAI